MSEPMLNKKGPQSMLTTTINTGDLVRGADVNTQHIMMMIDKGIKRNLMMINTERGRRARKVYMAFRFLKVLTFIGLLLISFFEKPEWCLKNPEISGTSDCQAPTPPYKYLTIGKRLYA
jgi:Na+/H+ antiporter NhaB